MSQVSDQDVIALKEWLDKETSLPNTFDDLMLKKFIFSCKGSLESTKRCIEAFCVGRRNMPEIFTDRDPTNTKIKDAFSQTLVGAYLAGIDEVLIHKLNEFSNKFDFYSLLKSFSLQADCWLRNHRDVLPENHVVILDIEQYSLMILSKVNVFYFQKYILFLLESMPVHLKEVHIINCPSYYEYLYAAVKTALPKSLCDMIHFHTDYNSLYEYIDKKYLPSDYGGEAENMSSITQEWVAKVYNDSKFLLNNELWKADIVKKGKKDSVEDTMTGSFKTLAID